MSYPQRTHPPPLNCVNSGWSVLQSQPVRATKKPEGEGPPPVLCANVEHFWKGLSGLVFIVQLSENMSEQVQQSATKSNKVKQITNKYNQVRLSAPIATKCNQAKTSATKCNQVQSS